MNTLEIDNFLHKNLPTLEHCVCACNELPLLPYGNSNSSSDSLKTEFYIISNTQPRHITDKGHWVCCILTYPFNIFFDSFGRSPTFYKHGSYFTKFLGPHFIHSTMRIQALDSSVCGEMCLYIIKHLQTSSFQDILTFHFPFPQHYRMNDALVRSYVHSSKSPNHLSLSVHCQCASPSRYCD